MNHRIVLPAVIAVTFGVLAHLQAVLSLMPWYPELYRHHLFYVPEGIKSLLQIAATLELSALVFKVPLLRVAGPGALRLHQARGAAVAVVASLPVLLTGLLLSDHYTREPLPALLYLCLLSPLAEELLYRGYAFGTLHRRVGLFWLWAALLVALIFALGHIEKATDPLHLVQIFLITGLGSVLFSWLLHVWGNLWVPLLLHILMNTWWIVFDLDQVTRLPWLPVAAQLLSAGLAVLLTLFRHRLPGLSRPVAP